MYACRYLLLESQSAQTWLPLTCRIEEPAAGSTPELLRFYKQTNTQMWNHTSWRELSEAISINVCKFSKKNCFDVTSCLFLIGRYVSVLLTLRLVCSDVTSVVVTLRFCCSDVALRTLASLALELSLHCRLVNICCSIAVTHSSRSYKNNNNTLVITTVIYYRNNNSNSCKRQPLCYFSCWVCVRSVYRVSGRGGTKLPSPKKFCLIKVRLATNSLGYIPLKVHFYCLKWPSAHVQCNRKRNWPLCWVPRSATSCCRARRSWTRIRPSRSRRLPPPPRRHRPCSSRSSPADGASSRWACPWRWATLLDG